MPVVSMPTELSSVTIKHVESIRLDGEDVLVTCLRIANVAIEEFKMIAKDERARAEYKLFRPYINDTFDNKGYSYHYANDKSHGDTYNDLKLYLPFTSRKHMVLEAIWMTLEKNNFISLNGDKVFVNKNG